MRGHGGERYDVLNIDYFLIWKVTAASDMMEWGALFYAAVTGQDWVSQGSEDIMPSLPQGRVRVRVRVSED